MNRNIICWFEIYTNGGKAGENVVKPRMALGEHDFISLCIDSECNTFGLYSME